MTMCICPVCSFSAPSPHRLDEHMELEHGENNNSAATTLMLQKTRAETPHLAESTPKRFRASLPPMSRIAKATTGDLLDLSNQSQLEAKSFLEPNTCLSDSNMSSTASPLYRGSTDTFEDVSGHRSALDATGCSNCLSEQSSINQNCSMQADSRRRYR